MAAKPGDGTTRWVPVSAAALDAARLRAGALGRRFAVADLDDVLVAGAVAYARSYQGAFPFMVMMRRASHRPLSVSQTVGVLNCLRADVLHQRPSRQVDVAGVPDGAYAVENLGGGTTFLRFARVAAGPRTGWVLVDQEVRDDLRARGYQRPGGSYRGLLAELVAAVVADPLAAAARYGQERRVCGVCGRRLTSTESRGRGLGPVCCARLAADRTCGVAVPDSASTPRELATHRPRSGRPTPPRSELGVPAGDRTPGTAGPRQLNRNALSAQEGEDTNELHRHDDR